VTREEKIAMIRCVKESVNVPVIANTGTYNTKDSILYTQDAEAAGADGILLVTPYYNKPDQDMLYWHFGAIASAVKLPVMLYNIPGRSVVNINAETVVRLARDHKNIRSIKEASGNLDALTCIIRDCPADFVCYTGEDSLTLPTLAVGGYGVVSVAGHIAAPQMKAMMEAYVNGNIKEAAKIHVSLQAINRALFLQPNPVPVKKALELCGFPVGGLRPPLREASAAVSGELKKAMEALGL
jgi:4-hydroxy-tetrahydrodipicolinate synthase